MKTDTNNGLIIPTDEEIVRIAEGLDIKDSFEERETAGRGLTLAENVEANLYTYRPYRVLSAEGIAGRTQKTTAKQNLANLVWLTSVRDVGRYDLNGTDIVGIIETANTLINECVGLNINEEEVNLGNFIRIRGIITDDLDHPNRDDLGQYPVAPKEGKPWIHPLDATNDRGEKLMSITEHIPSSFRITRKEDKELAKQERLEFEDKIFKVSQQMGADILVSDHFMIRLIHLIKESRYGIGKILNIHPGISDKENPSRLPGSTPTIDAISRAKWGAVYNRKSKLFLPADQRANKFKTGASLHVIDEGLDEGRVIADSETTRVFQTDRPQRLRRRNYPLKRMIFVVGIIHYVRTMLNIVDVINFRSGERKKTKTNLTIPNKKPRRII